MRVNNPRLDKINDLLQTLYSTPSMSIYSDLVLQCDRFEYETNNSYVSDKLSNIRIEAKMIASDEYEQGFSFQRCKQNMLGDINDIESELIYRETPAN